MIDTSKLTALEFCIIVMWLHGWTIRKIHISLAKRHGKTEHAVRGIINKIPTRRQAMLKAERQSLLDQMKSDRIDDGMLISDYFIAKPLASDQKAKAEVPEERKAKPVRAPDPEPDPKTRAGRAELKRRRQLAEKKRLEAEAARERREQGLAPRGVEANPLEYLYNQKMLSDKAEEEGMTKDRSNNAMRRYEAGVRLRSMLESIYGSGIKSQDFESAGGGGGAGVVIHAVVAENIQNVESIRSLMQAEWFHMLESVLLRGLFVWQIPSAKGSELVLAEIRSALDKVSLFLGTMPTDEEVDLPKRADRNAVRESVFFAREEIRKAQRQAR